MFKAESFNFYRFPAFIDLSRAHEQFARTAKNSTYLPHMRLSSLYDTNHITHLTTFRKPKTLSTTSQIALLNFAFNGHEEVQPELFYVQKLCHLPYFII